MKRLTLAAVVAVLAVLAMVNVALAVDPPNSLTFEATGGGAEPEISAYRDLLVTGDLVIVAQYNISYTTTPDDGADINFIGRARETSPASTLGVNTPYPFNDSGYGRGVISWYLDADDTEDAGYTDANGNWSAWPLTSLAVDLSTNPTVFDSADQRTTGIITLSSGMYSSGSGQDTNQDQLGNKLVAIARGLEAAWGVSLVNEAGRLNDTGSTYFQLAIPGVLSMAGDAFGSSSTSPTIPTPVPTPGGAGTLAETAENRFSGTFWLTPAFDSTGQTLGLPAGAFDGLLTAVTILIVTAIGLSMGGPSGAAAGFGIGTGVILPVFAVLGFVAWGYGILAIAMLVVMAVVKIAKDHLA